jgi:Protein of unknown function (DUF3500)
MRKSDYCIALFTLSALMVPFAPLHAVESVIGDMQQAAVAFVDSLPDELKKKAGYGIGDEERVNWHFVPRVGARKGIVLKDLNEEQREKLNRLLQASLSAKGQAKVFNVMSLETVLRTMEGAAHRDPELYYTTFFGEPRPNGTWGWRYEGHHLSLNFTVVNGKLLEATPNFWGASPARVPVGPNTGLRTLKNEEDLARAFVLSLDERQRVIATIAEEAPADIYTGAAKEVSPLNPLGIKVSELQQGQVFGLSRLIDEYLANMPADVANDRWEKLHEAGLEEISFAWAGSTEEGAPHYYRIQGPTFLIEYDNVQDQANHIHSVWRDFDGDFGRDILRDHHRDQH